MSFFGLFSDKVNEIIRNKNVDVIDKIYFAEVIFEKYGIPIVLFLL
jgi:hypothetical protein